MRALLFSLTSLLLIAHAGAGERGVLVWEINQPIDQTYDGIYAALEDNRFFVVFEPDIQKNLSGFAERWGENYNRNGLEGIRAMVFCNGWYANEVSNADPDMLALCPLHITLVQKAGKTRILFSRPTHIAAGTPAMKIASELEAGVSAALDQAVASLSADKPAD